jgi:hypothetical protein
MIRVKRILAGFTIIATPIIYFGLLFTTYGLGAFEDDLIQYFPNIQWFGEQLRSGVFPFWNSLVYGGYPQVSDPQSGILYPINTLSAILPDWMTYPLLIIIHYWIAGWGMYRLGRQWEFTRGVSTFGAVAWMFCGFMLGHRTHYTILAAASWMSVIFYLWTRISHEERPRALFVIAVFCQSLQILAGQVQVAALSGAAVLIYLIVTLERHRFKTLFMFCLSYLLTFGLAAIELIPVWSLYANSVRSANSYRFITENSFLPLVWPMVMAPASLGLRVPNFLYEYSYFGPWNHCELNCFTTIAALTLGAFAVRNAWRNPGRRRLVIFGAILAGLALFLAMGRYNPAFKLLYNIPVFRPFRCPARYLLWFNFAVAVLAMLGAQSLLYREYSDYFRRFARRMTVGLIIAFVVFFAVLAIVARTGAIGRAVPESLAYIPAGIIQAVHPLNPALGIPILLALSLIVLCRFVPFRHLPRAMLVLMIVEIGAFAPFYDFHFDKIGKVDLKPAIAEKLDEISPDRNGFVWPMSQDSYVEPLSRLEPFTNMLVDRPTITGYGPLLNKYHRRLFGWELWPTTGRYLELLTRPELLGRFNIKFIVAETVLAEQIDYLKSLPIETNDTVERVLVEKSTTIDGRGQSWSVPQEQGLYKIRFAARRLSKDELRMFMSVGPLASTIWGGQKFSLSTWDVGEEWRTFEWYFFVPDRKGGEQVRLNFSMDSGQCEIRNMLLSRTPFKLDHLSYRGEDPQTGAKLYENSSARGKAYFTQAVRSVDEAGDLGFRRMKAVEHVLFDDHAATTWVTSRDEFTLPKQVGHGRIVGFDEHTNSLDLKVVVMTLPAVMVVPGGYENRWRATVDGFEVPMLCADGISRAIIVPSGEHDVTLTYVPDSFLAGVAVAAFTTLLMIFIFTSGLAMEKESGKPRRVEE